MYKRFFVLVISKGGAWHNAPLKTLLFITCANAIEILKSYVGNATIADNVVYKFQIKTDSTKLLFNP